jgi:hypothetical protein
MSRIAPVESLPPEAGRPVKRKGNAGLQQAGAAHVETMPWRQDGTGENIGTAADTPEKQTGVKRPDAFSMTV